MKQFAILSFCIGIIIGSAFEFVLSLGIVFALFLTLVGFSISVLLFTSTQKNIFLASLFLFGAAFGVFRTDIVLREAHLKILQIQNFEGKTTLLHGVVRAEPDGRDEYTNIILTTDRVVYGNVTTTLTSNVLVRAQSYPPISYGDEITVMGKLQPPENFSASPVSSKQFNYIAYLAKDGIYETVSYPKIEILSHKNGNKIIQILLSIKQIFVGTLQSFLPEPSASLMNGILLGAKQSLGKDLLAEFQKAGVSHVVVLSGYNVAVVVEYMMKTLQFLPSFAMYLSGFIGLLLFVGIVGAQATVLRAAIMASIALIGRILGREYDALIALFIAAALMALHNPYVVLYDPSFQLSFLATLGLISFTDVVQPHLSFVTQKFGLKEILVTTLSAQILVLPLIVYDIGATSLLSLPANILIVSLIPVTMFFGFTTGVLGLVFSPLGFVCSVVSYALLSYILFVVRIIASTPFTQISLNISFTVLLVIYLIIGIMYLLLRPHKTNVKPQQHE